MIDPAALRELVKEMRDLGVAYLRYGDVELELAPISPKPATGTKLAPKAKPEPLKVPTQTGANGQSRRDDVLFRSGVR